MITYHDGIEQYPVLADRISPSAYGIGICLAAGKAYLSNGTSWSDLQEAVTNANLTGEVTSVGNATTVTNAAVIAKVLTGFVSGAGAVAATDTILQAINKLDGNIAAKATASAISGDYYVAASSGGAVTTKLTFTNGVLTAVA